MKKRISILLIIAMCISILPGYESQEKAKVKLNKRGCHTKDISTDGDTK